MSEIAPLLAELAPEISEQLWAARARAYTFGDSYGDIYLFLSELRRELIEARVVPAYRAHWTGDSARRTLRERLDELLDDNWPELLPESLVTAGPAYPGVGGLSIYLPQDECPGVELAAYQRGEFSQKTGWGTFVEAMLRNRPRADPFTGHFAGTGTTGILSGGTSHALDVYCDVRHGNLEIYTRDASSGLDVLVSAQRDEGAWLAKSVVFYDGTDFLEWAGEPFSFDAEPSDDLPTSGTVSVQASDKTIEISFTCEAYEDRTCGG